jgi:hypothetical protein
MDPQPFQLYLRIRHPSVDPAALSRDFKIEPEHAYRAGEPRPTRSGITPRSVHAESYWLGTLDPLKWPPDISFPEHPQLQAAAEHLQATATNSLGWALSLSTTTFFHLHAALLRRITSEGGQISLLVTLSASEVGSFSLSPEVSRAFGDFGVTVEFELTSD